MKAIASAVATLIVAQAFIASVAAESAEPVESVDFWGEPSLISIRGCQSYQADDIHRALLRHADVRLAAHRNAPLKDYLAVLRVGVENGYRTEGFRDPEIDVERDLGTGRIVITIHEGDRFKAGAVRVDGAKNLSSESLVNALTRPRFGPGTANSAVAEDPDGQDGEVSGWVGRDGDSVRPHRARWPLDDYAPLDDRSQSEIKDVIHETYVAAGRHAPQFETSTLVRAESNVIELIIKIIDEGPASIVDEIEIKGLEKNSREDVVKFLDVKPGMLLTRREITRIERTIWRSGRFGSYAVAAQPPEKPGDKFKLKIKLREYAKAAVISQPLTAEEAALLRLRQWLISPARRNVDFLVQSPREELPGEIIIAPGRGVLAWIGAPGSGAISGLQYAAVFSNRLTSLYAAERSEKLELAPSDWRIKIPAKISLNTTGKDPFYFSVGCGIAGPRKDAPRQTCEFSLIAPPAFALALAHEHVDTTACQVIDGVLHLRNPKYNLRANAETGEMIDCQFESPGPLQVFVVHGVFDERLAELRKLTANYQQTLNAARPLTSILRYFCDDGIVRLFAQDEGNCYDEASLRAVSIVAHFLDCGVLAPLDVALCDDSSSEFSIPWSDYDWAFDQNKMRYLLPWFDALFPTLSDNLFAADSWAQRLWREMLLAKTGRDQYLSDELGRWLGADQLGPLECAALAIAIPSSQTTSASQKVADLGLQRMSTGDFRRDCRTLLDPASVAGRTLLQIAQAIRTLEQADAEYLLSLDPSLRKMLIPLFQSLRDEPRRPLSEALGSGLEGTWEAGLRAQVAGFLKSIRSVAGTPDPTNRQDSENKTATGLLPEAKHPAAIGGISGTPLGLEGFCPVTLLEQRRWMPGDSALAVVVQGRAYWPADSTAKQKFEQDISRYVPKFNGDDLVAWFDQGKRISGERGHGIFFDQRIYLFANEQNLATFSADPTRYMNPPLYAPNAAIPEGPDLILNSLYSDGLPLPLLSK